MWKIIDFDQCVNDTEPGYMYDRNLVTSNAI